MKDQLDSLMKNSLKYMEKSIAEFEVDQQFATINFFTSIELILKARLFSEHWTLIVDNITSVSEGDVVKGNFKSVSLKDANSRLVKILKDGFNKDDFKVFEEIQVERNKMVHFHSTESKERTASLLCKGWLILDKKITGNWKNSFFKNLEGFNTINSRIHTIQKFLSEKYEKLETKIDGEMKSGTIYLWCPSCNYLSMKKQCIFRELHAVFCMVCNIQSKCLVFACPKCKCKVYAEVEFNGQCPKCGITVNASLILNHFDDSTKQIAYCGECSNFERKTVIPFYEKFLCLNCFDIVEDLGYCNFCDNYWTNIGVLLGGNTDALCCNFCVDDYYRGD